MTVEFRPAQQASEVAHALDVIEDSLGRETGDYFALLYDSPQFDPRWIQVAVDDGRIIGTLAFVPRTMRMGQSAWPTAVFLPLATNADAAQDVAEGLVAQALAASRQHGCTVATVLGDPITYAKLGFVPVRPSYATLVPVVNVVESESNVVVREFTPGDMERVAAFQQARTQARSWSIERDSAWWQWQRQLWEADDRWATWRFFSSPADFLIVERDGNLVGYARLQVGREEEVLLCTEVEVSENDHEAAAELLWRIRNRAVAAQRQLIHLPAPRSIPFVTQVFEVAGQHLVRPAAASMMRLLDLPSALDALGEEFAARLAASRFAECSASLPLGVGDDEVILNIGQGRVSVSQDVEIDEDAGVEIGEKAMAELLAGYRSAAELRAAGQIECADEEAALLAALFPAGEPFTWGADLLY